MAAQGSPPGSPPEPADDDLAGAPSVLLVTDDNWMRELAVPPEHAGDVHAFVVEATGEEDLQYEDVLVSSLPPALTLAVYTTCTLRADVAVCNELASTLLGRAVFGPAVLVCLEGLQPAEGGDLGGEGAGAAERAGPGGFVEFRVVTAEALARRFAERGRPVPECGAKIGFPSPFGDLFLALCAHRAHRRATQGARGMRVLQDV